MVDWLIHDPGCGHPRRAESGILRESPAQPRAANKLPSPAMLHGRSTRQTAPRRVPGDDELRRLAHEPAAKCYSASLMRDRGKRSSDNLSPDPRSSWFPLDDYCPDRPVHREEITIRSYHLPLPAATRHNRGSSRKDVRLVPFHQGGHQHPGQRAEAARTRAPLTVEVTAPALGHSGERCC